MCLKEKVDWEGRDSWDFVGYWGEKGNQFLEDSKKSFLALKKTSHICRPEHPQHAIADIALRPWPAKKNATKTAIEVISIYQG